jgi:hypothetical protein
VAATIALVWRPSGSRHVGILTRGRPSRECSRWESPRWNLPLTQPRISSCRGNQGGSTNADFRLFFYRTVATELIVVKRL